jgi:protein-S-isoprenylcysteine O-methyltransferase Ste14
MRRKDDDKPAVAAQKKPMPPVLAFFTWFNDTVGVTCPPGPRCLPWYWIINFQKGGTLPYCVFLMYHFDNWSTPCLFYTGMHGYYGLVWLLKHFAFNDPKWSTMTTVMGSLNSFLLVLGPYWLAPYMLMSRVATPPSDVWCLVCMIVYVLGVVIMCVADAHKHFVLKLRKGLIKDGLFRYVRHPNYLGEMMLYGAFAALVGHWSSYAVLAWVWLQIFTPNMLAKEHSMSRYPQWPVYYKSSGMLLPPLSAMLSGGK